MRRNYENGENLTYKFIFKAATPILLGNKSNSPKGAYFNKIGSRSTQILFNCPVNSEIIKFLINRPARTWQPTVVGRTIGIFDTREQSSAFNHEYGSWASEPKARLQPYE
jgi:hypothetical protein